MKKQKKLKVYELHIERRVIFFIEGEQIIMSQFLKSDEDKLSNLKVGDIIEVELLHGENGRNKVPTIKF